MLPRATPCQFATPLAVAGLDDLICMTRAAGRPADLDDLAALTEPARRSDR